ncbi:MAG: 2-succinyl-6-hydroxy-2,4-cyclohexadiene-1-carboxylate synthase [Anaerolineae bacterium]|nr:2-succinyl-6-hydroxy-2,4-cyclohexadiene-1-carboxylate synthase [Anaerolineae bacterium]
MHIAIKQANYHLIEEGQGEPLLLLHGFTGSSANWREHMTVLAQELRVIVVDLPGHGATNVPHYSMEAVAADLIAILDALNIPKVHLGGYSMGGRLALSTAIHYQGRIQSLILESASPGMATEAERRARIQSDEALARKIEQGGIEAFVQEWEQLPLFATQSKTMKLHLHKLRLQNSPDGLVNSLRGMGTGVQPSLWHKLPEFKIPVLLLAGEFDTKFTELARQMQAALPDADLEIIPGAGHTLHLEKPEQFDRAVLKVIRRARLDGASDYRGAY